MGGKERRVNKMTNRKYGIVALSCVVAGCFVCSPVFAEGPVDISIVEQVDDGSGSYKDWEDIVGAMPGDVYSAIPRIENNGSIPVAVRMCLSGVMTNYAGETMDLPSNAFGIDIGENWTLDNEDVADPTDPASGNCYRYNVILEPNSVTEPIFSEVVLSPMLVNEHQNATFSLHLSADAVEWSPDEPVNPNNPDTGTTTATGYDVTIVIPYVLAVAALVVLAIHLLRGIFRKR